jgi:hypothetical protein
MRKGRVAASKDWTMITKRFPVEEHDGRLFFRGADLGPTDRWPGWFGDYGGTGHTA